MKHGLLYSLGSIVLIMFTFASSPAQVNPVQQLPKVAAPLQIPVPTAPGPYYAFPSWDQKLPSTARFIVLSDWGNAAVLDKETGLVWEKSPTTNTLGTSWLYALYHCHNLMLGDRKGWRIPMVEELASLLDMSVPSGPKLPLGHPFLNVQPAVYLSATGEVSRFVVDFNTGMITSNPPRYVWCVRGPVSGNVK
jgi:hypothetical protein